MNSLIGIKTNWYTKVKKTLTCVQAIRLHTSHAKLDYTTYRTYKHKINRPIQLE